MPYDPEYVKSQQSEDFDPHLSIALMGGLVTEDEMSFFKIIKEGFPKDNNDGYSYGNMFTLGIKIDLSPLSLSLFIFYKLSGSISKCSA